MKPEELNQKLQKELIVKMSLLEDLGENLKWAVLEIDANKFGPDADAYIENIKKQIESNGYEIRQVFKKEDEQLYHIHIKNKK